MHDVRFIANKNDQLPWKLAEKLALFLVNIFYLKLYLLLLSVLLDGDLRPGAKCLNGNQYFLAEPTTKKLIINN